MIHSMSRWRERMPPRFPGVDAIAADMPVQVRSSLQVKGLIT
jgi:hypothetical protein